MAGIRIPIIAGIMPITSMSGCKRIAELAGGARFPAKLLRALQRCEGRPEMVTRRRRPLRRSNNPTISSTTHCRHSFLNTLNKSDATGPS